MKTKFHSYERSSKKGCSGAIAILLIFAGVLLLGTRLNLIPTPYVDVILSWQMLLISIGIVVLFKKHFIHAVILFSIGIFYIIPEIGKIPGNFLGNIPLDFTHLYWPVLLIIAGVLVLVRWIFFPKHCCPKNFHHHPYNHHKYWHYENHHRHGHFSKNKTFCVNGRVDQNTVFGAGENIVLDPEFTGGEINCVFGESTLDLRKTQLKETETHIEVNVVFGSAIIYVPKNWNVQLNIQPVFGGFVDKRSVLLEEEIDTTKTLVILGSCVFGGGEIRN